jgi:PilZ domain-containing protein
VSDSCTVLIGAADLLPGLTERAAANGEVLTFSDADALRALAAITKRKPNLVALERTFAVTPRGAALINRIKADPSLRQSEIRVLEHNSDYSRVIPRAPAPAPPALDQRGTRRSARVRIAPKARMVIDGKSATLIDLSAVGAQLVSPIGLKPNQQVSVTLKDKAGNLTFSATVVWTSFEIPPEGGARYRAGLNFVDADGTAVDAFGQRHKT